MNVCNTVSFNDLRLSEREETPVKQALQRVVDRGWFVLGPEVEEFEREFADFHGMPFAVGVANGTDAIELALRGAGVGPGDEVITVSHTAVPTICAIERSGARPILVDIDPLTYTMNPDALRASISPQTKAILPVHLYGHPAAMDPLLTIARRHGVLVIEDCAQAHGASYRNQLVGTFGDMAAFSFYPTKNLGGLGDGGAILCRDPQLSMRLRRLRNYGQSSRYHHEERGINSRLDEMQAAVLRVRLGALDEANEARRNIARYYNHLLETVGLSQPRLAEHIHHVYHLFVIRHSRRDSLRAHLSRAGVDTLIHYPVPIHLQPAYADLGYRQGALPVTEAVANEILSLPMYPGLTHAHVARVASAIQDASLLAA